MLLVAACSGGNDDDSDSATSAGDVAEDVASSDEGGASEESADEGAESAESADRAAADSGTDAGAPEPTATPVALTPADLGRSIVYTATIEIQAPDVEAATAEARQAVSALGGVVFGQQTTNTPQPRTSLVFKVGPDQFQAALDALAGVGEVVQRDVAADDVTERIVDLQSQIASAEVSVARLRELLDDADSVEAIAALEGQLLQRETALEQMRGQLRTLEDQVALSTISVTISQPAAAPLLAVASSAYAGVDDGARCPGADELTVAEGDDATMCLTIANAGNVAVTEIDVRDHRLGIDPDDVTLVDFDAEDVLEPGDEVVAWATFVADPDLSPSPDVSAVPVDPTGTQLRVSVATELTPLALTVEPDESLPGFGEALATGAGALGTILGVALVVIGIAVPFLVVGLPLAAAVVWWRRRNSNDTPPAPAAG